MKVPDLTSDSAVKLCYVLCCMSYDVKDAADLSKSSEATVVYTEVGREIYERFKTPPLDNCLSKGY